MVSALRSEEKLMNDKSVSFDWGKFGDTWLPGLCSLLIWGAAITHFAVETAGRFDMDAEMKIWIRGSSVPLEKEFKKVTDIVGVQKTLAQYVFQYVLG